MQLSLSTWAEVESYLANQQSIIVPIGSTEQHGPIGPIGTDAICAETLAQRAGERGGIMVGPTLALGIAQHHMAFCGTITLRPSTLIALVTDVVSSLASHGFERIYFLNGHGGNTATLQAAFAEVYSQRTLGDTSGRDVRCASQSWWMLPAVHEVAAELFGDSEGSHATPSEISVAQFAHPAAIRRVESLDPEVAPSGSFSDARDFRRRYPDGRIGSNPLLASPELGERLVDVASAAIVADVERFVTA